MSKSLLNGLINFAIFSQLRNRVNQGISQAGQKILFELPHNRKQEMEADHVGLLLMKKANFNIRKVPGFWDRMDDSTPKGRRGANHDLLQTHPSSSKRRDLLKNLVDKMIKEEQSLTGIYS